MPESSEPSTPWWQSTPATVLAVIGFAGAIVALAPLTSQSARNYYNGHGVLGWLIAAIALLVGSVMCIELLRRLASERSGRADALSALEVEYGKEVESVRKRARSGALEQLGRERQQHQSDIDTVTAKLGGFAEGGTHRSDLEALPTDKVFTYDLARSIETVLENVRRDDRTVYDLSLRDHAAAAEQYLRAYWDELSPKLDSSPSLAEQRYDLIIEQPPNGTWHPRDGNEWERYYSFVRSMAPLRFAFLNSLNPIDKRIHELRVEAARD